MRVGLEAGFFSGKCGNVMMILGVGRKCQQRIAEHFYIFCPEGNPDVAVGRKGATAVLLVSGLPSDTSHQTPHSSTQIADT